MAIILTKKSDTASSVPLAADLTNAAGGAELAVNTADKRLYSKTSGGAVVELGTNPSSMTLPNGTANGIPYLNGSKVLTSGSALTFDGSNFVVNPTNTQFYVGSSFAKIQNNAGASASFIMADTSDSATIKNVGSSIAFINSASEGMRLTSTGLGIGTSSPSVKLDVRGNAPSVWVYDTTGGNSIGTLTADGTGFTVSAGYASSAIPLIFKTSSAERARIDSSGNLLVGTTTTINAAKAVISFTSANNGLYVNDSTGVSGAQFMRFDSTSGTCGSITRVGTTSAITYNATSDYRLKTVIGSVTDSGTRIDALEPIEYEWKSDGSRTRGFLAHKFQEVYAGSVTGTKDAVDKDGKPVYQAMQAGSSEVIADLVAEIQSLRKRLAAAGI